MRTIYACKITEQTKWTLVFDLFFESMLISQGCKEQWQAKEVKRLQV